MTTTASQSAETASKTGGLLLYAPPSTDVTIRVPNRGVPWDTTLDNDLSYTLEFPDSPITSQVRIQGGHNIVIIGGAFEMSDATTSAALSFFDRNNTTERTIHVEGLDIAMDAYGKDAIGFSTPMSHLQLQNIRITGVDGDFDAGHADAIQNWGGARSLSIHKMSVRTNYQGFWIGEGNPTAEGFIGQVNLTEVEFARETNGVLQNRPVYLLLSRNARPESEGGSWCETYPGGASLDQVYFVPDDAFGDKEVYPSLVGPEPCKAQVDSTGTILTWSPGFASKGGGISGQVERIPAPLNIVPEGYAGIRYVSPGYVSSQ